MMSFGWMLQAFAQMQQHHRYPRSIAFWEIVRLNVQQLNLREPLAMDCTHQIRIVVLHGQQRHIYGQREAVFRAFRLVQPLHRAQHVHLVQAVMKLLVHRTEIDWSVSKLDHFIGNRWETNLKTNQLLESITFWCTIKWESIKGIYFINDYFVCKLPLMIYRSWA